VIVTDATADGRRVRLADANPAILTFPKTTLGELDDVRESVIAVERAGRNGDGSGDEEPPPNLGPPPPRLDWRKDRQ
jgi:hypothetical protein